jgi:MoxR-like ATPase
MTAADLPALRQAIAGVHVDERLLAYLRALLQATRSSPLLRHGASPRAGMGLLAVARARAAMEGRRFAIPDDIKRMAGPTLRHRLSTTPEADLDGLRVENVLDGILAQVPAPR